MPYLTPAEGRAADATFAGLSDAEISAAIAEVEDEIETLCPGFAFIPRTATATRNGTGGRSLWLPHFFIRTVTAVRTRLGAGAYTAYTAGELADIVWSDTGEVKRGTLGYWPAGFQNIEFDYGYGMDAPPPSVKRAATILLRYRLAGARWRIPSGSLAVDAEGNPTAEGLPAAETSGAASEESPSGIPLVDDLLRPWMTGPVTVRV